VCALEESMFLLMRCAGQNKRAVIFQQGLKLDKMRHALEDDCFAFRVHGHVLLCSCNLLLFSIRGTKRPFLDVWAECGNGDEFDHDEMQGGSMRYQDFSQRMHVVARQAELSHASLTAQYKRVVEILDASPQDPRGAERALWEEYDKTKDVFFQRKAWDLQRER
jgi:hypothetical protein